MFALGIQYLNGWAMAAADGPRKQRAEWPPHPDRVFMALAAAWFETGEDSGEGEALRWLESLPAPSIAASDAAERNVVTSYVPINDDGYKKGSSKTELGKLKKKGLALIPEFRSRQPRAFPLAIPHDPNVYLIWTESELDGYRDALASLASKVTHVGHSSSFVQAWVEDNSGITPVWEPAEGIVEHRLRVPFPSRLDQLKRSGNRDAWLAFHDLRDEISRAESAKKEMKQPPRVAWRDFPDAVLLSAENKTMRHRKYREAKFRGDAAAAAILVDEIVDQQGINSLRTLLNALKHNSLVLVSAHAYEKESVNAIPLALARLLSKRLGVPFEENVVQVNIVSHTGADGYGRLARQARFEGEIDAAREYLLVDDFIGQGGTLANLRGWIESRDGKVVGATALAGKPYSVKLTPSEEQLNELKEKHGLELERWWRDQFGHAFNCLTQSEARYLARSPDIDTIRNRLAAAQQKGDGRSATRFPREQNRYIKELKARQKKQFPDGQPARPGWPSPGRWQGYARSQKEIKDKVPHSVFDQRLIILGISGQRLPLSATLKLTAALRGLLLRECPIQPPPEWFSGHRADGTPSREAHMALVPLAFVDSPHADGGIMGIGVVLPKALQAEEAGRCLEPILRNSQTGLPREDIRLFDERSLSCRAELETRERPPWNLRPRAWTRPSRAWASVTPVVLNRHFDGDDRFERSAQSVKDACKHIGLPHPAEVILHPVSLVEGAPHAREFPQLIRSKGGGRQRHTHAVIIFEEPVAGPLLIGAGRFRGYGLFRPVDKRQPQGIERN